MAAEAFHYPERGDRNEFFAMIEQIHAEQEGNRIDLDVYPNHDENLAGELSVMIGYAKPTREYHPAEVRIARQVIRDPSGAGVDWKVDVHLVSLRGLGSMLHRFLPWAAYQVEDIHTRNEQRYAEHNYPYLVGRLSTAYFSGPEPIKEIREGIYERRTKGYNGQLITNPYAACCAIVEDPRPRFHA